MMHFISRRPILILATVLFLSIAVPGQEISGDFQPPAGQVLDIVNKTGRVEVIAERSLDAVGVYTAVANGPLNGDEIKIETVRGRWTLTVSPAASNKRIDLRLRLPERTRLRITTNEGEIKTEGNFESIEARTETGTIALDVPTDDIRYTMQWTASRPRFIADFELARVRERTAGRFEIKGRHKEPSETAPSQGNGLDDDVLLPRNVNLNLTTARGIVILNVPPNEVTADLRERPLTEAAKAIIRSGDTVLMDAIRRAAPKYFGEFERTLPPARFSPQLSRPDEANAAGVQGILKASVRVTDMNNRAVPGLGKADFEALENNRPVEIISVEPITAPVNLVLLLDVSGSVENYVNFIRKAAREFVNTVGEGDRISLIIFNEDIKVLAGFSTDKRMLSESLDTFDAGGATAYYDALAYTIAESLRPLRGERTAIVVLTDGDDNRSFLAFDSLIGAIEESGALIYSLYVPSMLVAVSAASGFQDIDPVRNRHISLTSKAEIEGRRLAEVSGGVYYPISQLSQLQTAYEDIVLQIRTAYEVTFRSELGAAPNNRPSPRLRIRSKQERTFTQISTVRRGQ
jgi:VWFA-related protein